MGLKTGRDGKAYRKPEVSKKNGKVTNQAKREYLKCVRFQRKRFEKGEIALTPEGRCSAEFTHRVYPSAYGNIAGAGVSRGNRITFLGEIDPDCRAYFKTKGEPVSEKCAAANGINAKAKIIIPYNNRLTEGGLDLNNLTAVVLREMLRDRGLRVSGNKQLLVKRLSDLDTDKPKGKARARSKPEGNLTRWIDERWVNVCEPDLTAETGYQPCGRPKAKLTSKDYPYCRPYYRINKQTPKTVDEIIKTEGRSGLAKRCKEKRELRQGIGGKPTYYRPDRKSKSSRPKSKNTGPNMKLVDKYNQLKACVDENELLYQPEFIKDSKRHKLRVKVRDPVSGKIKTVRYGHPDYQDYTTHQDQGRRNSYCNRSRGIRCGSRPGGACDQTSANFWSRSSLWDCPTSEQELYDSVSDPICRRKLRGRSVGR